MDNLSKDELFIQVRTAHRLLAAYYQRLYPKIQELAIGTDATFYAWNPVQFDKPTKSNSNPLKKWQWDLLPGLYTRYMFNHVADLSKVTKGDYTLEIFVNNDTGISTYKGNNQPDALTLQPSVEQAESIIQIGLYRAYINSDKTYCSQWDCADYPRYPNYLEHKSCYQDKQFFTIGFQMPIDVFMTEDGFKQAKESIDKCLELTAESVLSLS